LIGWAKGSIHSDERGLFRRLWDLLDPGDVLLGDCGFTSYADMALLQQRGVDSVLRNHQSRKPGQQVVKGLGKGNRLVRWNKPASPQKWIGKDLWAALPSCLLLREFTFTAHVRGLRTQTFVVVTTLTDCRAFPKHALVELYRRRWMAELFFRDIKISLRMDPLRCLSPDMIEKELHMHFIAYNLIRALILQAAQTHQVCPWRISFKGTLATVRQWAPRLALSTLNAKKRDEMTHHLLFYLARDLVPLRPHRQEPRARKRRPKNYPLLTKPRHSFVDVPHRNKYKSGGLS